MYSIECIFWFAIMEFMMEVCVNNVICFFVSTVDLSVSKLYI